MGGDEEGEEEEWEEKRKGRGGEEGKWKRGREVDEIKKGE
jgi:hypothetical protein